MSSFLRIPNLLAGKVVLITGASSGIGAATATAYAAAGASVVLVARRAERLAQVAEQCRAAALAAQRAGDLGAGSVGQFHPLTLDMTVREEVGAIKSRLPTWAREVDILVNNAGLVYGVDHVGALNLDEVQTMYTTNVLAVIQLTQLFFADFKARNAGHIVVLGSIAGREAYPGGSIYCSTKFAVSAFLSAMMKEAVGTRVRFTEVAPGMVETEFSVVRYRGDRTAADQVYAGIEPLTGADIAQEIIWATNRPENVNVAETVIMPVHQAGPYHNYRGSK